MPSSYNNALRLEMIGTGEQAGIWGDTTNNNLGTLLVDAVAGYTSVSITSANQALTVIDGLEDQSRNAMIALTTVTSANFSVYIPPSSKSYIFYNASSYTATIYNSTSAGNTTAAGTGVAIPAGKVMTVWSEGTNVAQQNTHLISPTLASPTMTTPALGTPASGVMTNVTGLPLTTGVTGTLPVANGGTGVTTSTGSGSVVLSTSPTLVTPALGTPASGVMTNVTGLPLTTGVTGTLPVANGGTGVTTSTGSGNNVLSTSPTLVTPALGTPSSVVLTNASGYASSVSIGGSASSATNATYATSAGSATNATYATSASSASSATNATYATSAGSATNATYAANSNYAEQSTYATSAGSSGYAASAGNASYASSSGYASSAGTARVLRASGSTPWSAGWYDTGYAIDPWNNTSTFLVTMHPGGPVNGNTGRYYVYSVYVPGPEFQWDGGPSTMWFYWAVGPTTGGIYADTNNWYLYELL